MKPRSSLKAEGVLWFALLLMSVVGVLCYASLTAYQRATSYGRETYEVLQHLAALAAAVKNAESAQRGYLLTGSEAYLDSYSAATRTLSATLDQVRVSTRDNPRQQERIVALETLVQTRLAELREAIEVARTGET